MNHGTVRSQEKHDEHRSVCSRVGETASWESVLQKHSVKDKLLHMDLRPMILLVVLLAGATAWVSMLYWLRHCDRPNELTEVRYQSQEAPSLQVSAAYPLYH